MWNNVSDFEVRIKGHSLVQVNNGEVKINGKDFHADLRNLSQLVDILSDVLERAEAIKKPRLVSFEENIPESAYKDNGPHPVKKMG